MLYIYGFPSIAFTATSTLSRDPVSGCHPSVLSFATERLHPGDIPDPAPLPTREVVINVSKAHLAHDDISNSRNIDPVFGADIENIKVHLRIVLSQTTMP